MLLAVLYRAFPLAASFAGRGKGVLRESSLVKLRPALLVRLSSSASHIFALASGMSILGSGVAFTPRPLQRGQKCLALARTWTKGGEAVAGGKVHACAASNSLPLPDGGRRRR